MPYCWKCGTELKEDANFCQKCGASVSRRVKREKGPEWWE
ncbi:MAG: zinc ribbon domain-containing protein [Candidatus Bathyarchaeota archaeon]|nr:MAG: zinc ribbon domain-containing protein [Candidatus Bathyarchaeota archaeon]